MGFICEQRPVLIMVKEKNYIAYKEMQDISIWICSLKFKFLCDITTGIIRVMG